MLTITVGSVAYIIEALENELIVSAIPSEVLGLPSLERILYIVGEVRMEHENNVVKVATVDMQHVHSGNISNEWVLCPPLEMSITGVDMAFDKLEGRDDFYNQ